MSLHPERHCLPFPSHTHAAHLPPPRNPRIRLPPHLLLRLRHGIPLSDPLINRIPQPKRVPQIPLKVHTLREIPCRRRLEYYCFCLRMRGFRFVAEQLVEVGFDCDAEGAVGGEEEGESVSLSVKCGWDGKIS